MLQACCCAEERASACTQASVRALEKALVCLRCHGCKALHASATCIAWGRECVSRFVGCMAVAQSSRQAARATAAATSCAAIDGQCCFQAAGIIAASHLAVELAAVVLWLLVRV